ncbi:MAG TPA: hypothetical protein VFW22_15125 [Pseudolabrys sp.]|nr:hypothetical protein [Pseudolabrys sp.]
MPDGDNDRNPIDGQPSVVWQKPRRVLVALLVAAILAMIVIATLTLH